MRSVQSARGCSETAAKAFAMRGASRARLRSNERRQESHDELGEELDAHVHAQCGGRAWREELSDDASGEAARAPP